MVALKTKIDELKVTIETNTQNHNTALQDLEGQNKSLAARGGELEQRVQELEDELEEGITDEQVEELTGTMYISDGGREGLKRKSDDEGEGAEGKRPKM